jgi:hypothetical protein
MNRDDYRYSYCSPCHKRHRSSDPAPMLSWKTDLPVFRANNTNSYHILFMCSPFASNRLAAWISRGFRGLVSSTLVGASRSRELRRTLLIITAPVPGTKAAKAVQFLLVGPENPGPANLRRLSPQHPAAFLPFSQGVHRHPEFSSQVAQPPFMAPKVLMLDSTGCSRLQPCMPGHKLVNHESVELSGASRRTESFLIETLGNLGARGTATP